MFLIYKYLTNLTKVAIFIIKCFFKIYILIKYFFFLIFKKKIIQEKSLFYGIFFLELGLFKYSKKILKNIPRKSKQYKYAQFFLGSYIFNNLKISPKSYFDNYFESRTSLKKNNFYPPTLAIFKIKDKFNLDKEINKYMKRKKVNSYSDTKQKKIYGYYQSEHDIYKIRKFRLFSKVIERKLILFTKNLFNLNNKYRYKIDRLWFVKSSRGIDLLSHNHPEGVLSGIFYYKVPKGDSPGILKIKNPRNNIKIITNIRIHKKRHKEILLKPVKNSIVVFNSYLLHSVQNQATKSARISIPFDANLYKY